ncbi:hypothetical protein FH972_021560 [Carpinus fangiana]|uniref:NACHT domain-containing protein n=1 Tax=Carpinus fangiana TaxID=176857 RepID=A0A5N6KPN0_9ROSI|nr:hypothetical protein FH972_021560 [Carpinus fangiana]
MADTGAGSGDLPLAPDSGIQDLPSRSAQSGAVAKSGPEPPVRSLYQYNNVSGKGKAQFGDVYNTTNIYYEASSTKRLGDRTAEDGNSKRLKYMSTDGVEHYHSSLLSAIWFSEMHRRQAKVSDVDKDRRSFKWVFDVLQDHIDSVEDDESSEDDSDDSDDSEDVFADPRKLVENLELHGSGAPKWDKLSEWLISGNDYYWISGKAGSGKSTLTDYIWTNQRTDKGLDLWASGRDLLKLRFFFWNPGSPLQRSFEGALAHEMPWSENQLSGMLKAIVSEAAKSDCCFCSSIDGLDELFGDRSTVLKLLDGLISFPHVKICVTSRLEPIDLTYFDIRNYVSKRIKSLSRRWPDYLVPSHATIQRLTSTISSRAEGVFLWVHLVVRNLLENPASIGDTTGELMKYLQLLPTELRDLYGIIVSRQVAPYHMEKASLYLHLMLCTQSWGQMGILQFFLATSNDFQRDFVSITSTSSTKPHFLEAARRVHHLAQSISGLTGGLLTTTFNHDSRLDDFLISGAYPGTLGQHLEDHVMSEVYCTTVEFLHRSVFEFISDQEHSPFLFDKVSKMRVVEKVVKASIILLHWTPLQSDLGARNFSSSILAMWEHEQASYSSSEELTTGLALVLERNMQNQYNSKATWCDLRWRIRHQTTYSAEDEDVHERCPANATYLLSCVDDTIADLHRIADLSIEQRMRRDREYFLKIMIDKYKAQPNVLQQSCEPASNPESRRDTAWSRMLSGERLIGLSTQDYARAYHSENPDLHDWCEVQHSQWHTVLTFLRAGAVVDIFIEKVIPLELVPGLNDREDIRRYLSGICLSISMSPLAIVRLFRDWNQNWKRSRILDDIEQTIIACGGQSTIQDFVIQKEERKSLLIVPRRISLFALSEIESRNVYNTLRDLYSHGDMGFANFRHNIASIIREHIPPGS